MTRVPVSSFSIVTWTKVKAHIELVDKNMYSKLLTHDDHDLQAMVKNFMSGLQEIRRIMSEYTKKWCSKRQAENLAIADHERFLKDSEEMFELVLERIQHETEKLYPLVKELSGNREQAA